MTILRTRRALLHRLAGTSMSLAAAAGPSVARSILPSAFLMAGPATALAQNSEDPMTWAPRGTVPAGYPDSYLATVRAAEDEARLTIYSTTDEVVARPLVEDFRRLYPRIAVDFDDQTATELNHRFIAESQLGREGADVLWSSAMDQQAQLIGRGEALSYESIEAAGLPAWARFGTQGWSTTLEPISIVYDRRRLTGADAPTSHAALRKLLEADPARFDRKIVLYDVPRSGVGYLLAAQDQTISSNFWRLAAAFGRVGAVFSGSSPAILNWELMTAIGRCRPRTVLTADAMLRSVERGESLIAYNVLGDYARARAARSESLAVVYPSDYTLVLSRVMFISRHARHPNAARLWVDYLLSRRGQEVLANGSRLHSVRDDIDGELAAAALSKELGDTMRPIAFEARLAEALASDRYAAFISAWHRAMGRSLPR